MAIMPLASSFCSASYFCHHCARMDRATSRVDQRGLAVTIAKISATLLTAAALTAAPVMVQAAGASHKAVAKAVAVRKNANHVATDTLVFGAFVAGGAAVGIAAASGAFNAKKPSSPWGI